MSNNKIKCQPNKSIRLMHQLCKHAFSIDFQYNIIIYYRYRVCVSVSHYTTMYKIAHLEK